MSYLPETPERSGARDVASVSLHNDGRHGNNRLRPDGGFCTCAGSLSWVPLPCNWSGH